MISDKLIEFFKSEGYNSIRFIDGRGVCGVMKFIFTTGLCYGLDETGYTGRYCFENTSDAKEALEKWDGIGDPDANWIKHKGRIEYSNPKSLTQ